MWETGVSLDAKGSDLSRFLAQVKNPANYEWSQKPTLRGLPLVV